MEYVSRTGLNKLRVLASGLILASMSLSGCDRTKLEEPQANPIPTSTTTTTATVNNLAGVLFNKNPESNFSVSNCDEIAATWVNHIDSQPNDIEDPNKAHTIGFVERYEAAASTQEPAERPVLLLGATILGVGNMEYSISTSNNPTETKTIHLAQVTLRRGINR